jgi:hypothetical protein
LLGLRDNKEIKNMSYENPQTVIDTESAKYYAQAISNLGLTAAKFIDAETERKRKETQANKKRNLENSKARTEYNSKYLSTINKSLLNAGEINLKPQLREKLNGLIGKAVDLKIQLDNFTGKDKNGNDISRSQLQNELNSLETLFESGLGEGLGNLSTSIEGIAQAGVNGGQESGLSYSHNNSYMISDIMSTQLGQESKVNELDIKKIDGVWNLTMDFIGEKRGEPVQTILDESGKARNFKARSYNLNTDLGADDLIINPDITSVAEKSINEFGYLKDGVPNPKSGISSIYSDVVDEKTVGEKTYYRPTVDLELLNQKLKPSLEAAIGGVIKQGRANDGDQAYGLLVMQSYVDDVLPDNIDADIGILKPDPSTVSGISQEQFEKISLYVSAQQKVKLDASMLPDEELGFQKPDKPTEGAIKRSETSERLKKLTNKLDKLNTKRPTVEGTKKQDIIFDSEFQKELLPEFSFKSLKGDLEGEYLELKSTATNKTAEIPSKGLTDARLKMTMYILDGGNTSDPAYLNLEKELEKESKVKGLPIVFDPNLFIKD